MRDDYRKGHGVAGLPVCVACGGSLQGRQTHYCSRVCKNAAGNAVHQCYRLQRSRGLERKLELVRLHGGRCRRCGYASNLAALEFHHPDPKAKEFQLDMRALSNRRWTVILAEASRCELLCSNCHAEVHNPGFDLRIAESRAGRGKAKRGSRRASR